MFSNVFQRMNSTIQIVNLKSKRIEIQRKSEIHCQVVHVNKSTNKQKSKTAEDFSQNWHKTQTHSLGIEQTKLKFQYEIGFLFIRIK